MATKISCINAACPWSVAAIIVLCGVCVLVESAEPVFHCCVPKLWNAHMRTIRTRSFISTNPDVEEFWNWMHYDSDNQRIASIITTHNSPDHQVRLVLDYKQGTAYEIFDETTCRRHQLADQFRPLCTPQNVTMVAFALAPRLQPLEGVFANTAYFKEGDVTGHMTVTVGNCALVAESTFHVPFDGGQAENTQYFNQTLSIDPAAFTLPSSCAQQDVEPTGSVNYGSYFPATLRLCENLL